MATIIITVIAKNGIGIPIKNFKVLQNYSLNVTKMNAFGKNVQFHPTSVAKIRKIDTETRQHFSMLLNFVES